jgi:BASS family bile acid:Na+ symporter
MFSDSLEFLDTIRLNFNSEGLLFLNATLAFVMFGVALELKTEKFKKVFVKPKSAFVGIFAQFFLLPLLTLLLVLLINPSPSIALGMILVSACPGGNISNFMSKLAGGNAALSVSLTAFASFAALLMTPFNFAVWGNLYPPTSELLRTVALSPLEVAKLVLLILGVPLVAGMLLKNYFSNFATKASKFLKPVSILIFILFIAVAFYTNLDIFTDYIHHVLFLVVLHNAVLILVGFYFAKWTGLNYEDQKTLGIEIGIQNSGLGLLLVFSFFEGLGGMALLVAFWAIWDIVSGLLIAYFWSGKATKTLSI